MLPMHIKNFILHKVIPRIFFSCIVKTDLKIHKILKYINNKKSIFKAAFKHLNVFKKFTITKFIIVYISICKRIATFFTAYQYEYNIFKGHFNIADTQQKIRNLHLQRMLNESKRQLLFLCQLELVLPLPFIYFFFSLLFFIFVH